MRGLCVAALLGALFISSMPAVARAGNSDEVNAGLDVTLTGGAVVANVYTGAALWYNPAGLARLEKGAFELTGITLEIQVIKNPGLVTIDSMPPGKSEGSSLNFAVIPQAVSFTIKMKNENLKLGIGLFNSSLRREFLTEQASSPQGASPEVKAFAGRNSKLDFYHISSGLAGTFGKNTRQKVLFGGAFDLVVASSRVDDSYSVFYDDGTSGQQSQGEVGTQTGFGFQLKSGIQWVPIPKVRIGFSVASPTYVFAVLERFATSSNQAPPAGTIDTVNPQLAAGSEGRGGRGVWWGVEPGNLRFGVAYVGHWGWVEADLIYYFRLREEGLGLDLRGFLNGRIGSAFRVSKNVKLGLGLFTDFSQVDQLTRAPLATRKVDFYGVHLGILYSSKEVHPDRRTTAAEDEGVGFSIAVGIRYAHGRGDTLGVQFPAQYDPSAVQLVPIATKVNEIAINLGANVAF